LTKRIIEANQIIVYNRGWKHKKELKILIQILNY